tara:strand:+ start:518 stop:928 length:411 start_codon:yes stop_codon:yes gene_type:complete
MTSTSSKCTRSGFRSDEIYKSQSIEQSLTPPETPPYDKIATQPLHPWPEPETAPVENAVRKRRKTLVEDVEFNITHQEVLLLHAPKQRYEHTKQQPIPDLKTDREMLVEVEVVGLNPIDWKAPYVFAIKFCFEGSD